MDPNCCSTSPMDPNLLQHQLTIFEGQHAHILCLSHALLVEQICLLLDFNSIGPSNDDDIDHVEEEAMLHNPDHLAEHISSLLSILDEAALKVTVDDVIGVICDVWLAVLGSPQLGCAAFKLWEILQPLEVVVPAKLGHLNWHCICTCTDWVNFICSADKC